MSDEQSKSHEEEVPKGGHKRAAAPAGKTGALVGPELLLCETAAVRREACRTPRETASRIAPSLCLFQCLHFLLSNHCWRCCAARFFILCAHQIHLDYLRPLVVQRLLLPISEAFILQHNSTSLEPAAKKAKVEEKRARRAFPPLSTFSSAFRRIVLIYIIYLVVLTLI